MCAHIHTNTLICSGRHQRTTTNTTTTIPTTETTTTSTITIPTIQTTTTATITATSARAPARVADHTTGITSHSLTSLACLLPSAQRPREVEEVPVVLGGRTTCSFSFFKSSHISVDGRDKSDHFWEPGREHRGGLLGRPPLRCKCPVALKGEQVSAGPRGESVTVHEFHRESVS